MVRLHHLPGAPRRISGHRGAGFVTAAPVGPDHARSRASGRLGRQCMRAPVLEAVSDTVRDLQAAASFGDDRLILDYESPVQEDKAFRLAVMQAAPWAWNADEWRDFAGLDPIEAEGVRSRPLCSEGARIRGQGREDRRIHAHGGADRTPRAIVAELRRLLDRAARRYRLPDLLAHRIIDDIGRLEDREARPGRRPYGTARGRNASRR